MAKVQVNSEGCVQGVVLEDGTEVRSKVVLSNTSPQITFLKLTPQVRLQAGGWSLDVCQNRGWNLWELREPGLHQGVRCKSQVSAFGKQAGKGR